MEWVRGDMIGKGSFGSVYLATPMKGFSADSLMAVKSVSVSESSLLRKEKDILSQFSDCPQILKCFGEDYTSENADEYYNIFLEFASRGNLKELVRKYGGCLSESMVKHYAKSILKGLRRIHKEKYVHCDIKLENILLSKGSAEVKIADFGLAKKAGEKLSCFGLRGTPLYMSPESISGNQQEAPSDIWALGCVVVEMITGRPAWNCRPDTDVSALLFRIGCSEELPEIPAQLSDEGKDFLRKCFVKDPLVRWSAEMLLSHPFVHADNVTLQECDQPPPSPRSPFGFPYSSRSSNQLPFSNECLGDGFNQSGCLIQSTRSPSDRIRELRSEKSPKWSFADSWVTAREAECSVNGKERLIR